MVYHFVWVVDVRRQVTCMQYKNILMNVNGKWIHVKKT